jgi:hypothetical protein
MRKSVLFATATVALLATTPAFAYDLDFNQLVTGDTPSGGPDYAHLSIENAGMDAVNFTLSQTALADPGQFLSRLFVNLDKSYSNLNVSSSDGQFNDWNFKEDGNNFGGGQFDFKFLFDTANSGDRVYAGDSVSWTVTGDGLTEDSFRALSDHVEYPNMLHIQGIGPNGEGSAHVTSSCTEPVPEPGTMLALGVAATGLLARRRRKI